MLSLSFLIIIILEIILHKSEASSDLQELCKDKRFGDLVPNPDDCNSFYTCQFIVQLKECDRDLHFDRINQVCNWPEYAGCDWVPVEKPEKPLIPETGQGSKPSEEANKPPGNPTIDDYITEKPQKPSDSSAENQNHPPGYPTVDDYITEKPQKPSDSSAENQDHPPVYPTVDDYITEKPQKPSDSSAENQNHPPGYPTVDDYITEKPQKPSDSSAESQNHPPGYPTVDDFITEKQQKPSDSSAENQDHPTVDDFITEKPQKPSDSSAENQDHPTVDDFITEKPQKPSDSSAENQDHPTVDDFITEKPQKPSDSSAENQDHPPGYPNVDDNITKKPQKPSDSSAENQDHPPGYPTVDDYITEKPQKPSDSSAENQDHPPGYPTVDDVITDVPIVTPSIPVPNHPNKPEVQPNPETPKPPQIDEIIKEPDVEGSIDLPSPPTAGDHSSHHWNLIASIVSVKSSHTDGFINFPTVGAHSPQTGYPVDVMTGYDPKNVQCLHNGLYFLPHPNSCQKYFICAYHHLHLHSCGNGVVWNHKREQCDLSGNARCYSRDVEGDQSTERATPLIETEEATRESIKTTSPKPQRKTKTTRLPVTSTNAGQKQPICPGMRQAYLPNLDDCHKYFICILGKPVLTSCPSGMHWDVDGEICGNPSGVRCARR